MKKLLLTLILLVSAGSVHGMELESPKQLSPITLPQIYQHFSQVMLSDIARHLFSVHSRLNGIDDINEDIIFLDETNTYREIQELYMRIDEIRYHYGHCYAVEKLRRNLLSKKISICDVRSNQGRTLLHESFGNTKNIKLFLEVTGNDVWTLLAMQKEGGSTALYIAAREGKTESVKLLLDAAGNQAKTLINIPNDVGWTTLDIADLPKTREVIRQYLQK